MDTPRVFIDREHPEAQKAAVRWSVAVRRVASQAGLDRRTVELINLRASQLSGCAACLGVHTRKALASGETMRRIGVLPAWRHSGLFTERERAILDLTEAVTLLPDEAAQEAAFERAAAELTEEEISAVSWVAIAINAFNRISIVSRHPVGDWTEGEEPDASTIPLGGPL